MSRQDATAAVQAPDPRPSRLLTRHEVCRRVGVSPATLHRLVARKQFPAPIHLGARASRWVEAEVDARIAELIADRERPDAAA